MKFDSFGIANFKAFGTPIQRIPLKPITLIFGANSAGKSSLLHSLLWASEVSAQGIFDIRTSSRISGNLDLGGFQSVIRDHKTSEKIIVSIQPSDTCGEFPVEIIFEIGLRQPKNDEQEYKKLFESDDDITTFLNANDSYRNSVKILREWFTFPSDEESFILENVTAALSSSESWISHTEKQLQQRIEGEWPSITVLPYEQAKEVFHAGQSAWLTAKKLALLTLPKLKKYYEDFEIFRLSNDPGCSVTSCEVRAGNKSVLKAERRLGSNALIVDSNSIFSPFWQQLSNSENSSSPPINHRHNSCLALGSLRFSRDTEIPNGDELGQLIQEIAIPWLYQKQHDFSQFADKFIMIGPLRSLPARRELLGFPGESTTNPLLLPWFALRDDNAIRESVNMHLTHLTGNDLSFERLVYARIGRVARIEDELPQKFRQLDGGRPVETDWKQDSFIEGFSEYPSEMIPEEKDPLYEDLKYYDPDTADQLIEKFLQKHYPDEYLVDLALKTNTSKVTVSMQDVGVGISQIAPVLVQTLGYRDRFIAIEQPELHLHPALQAELGDVFIESALGENKNRFLLETHSEHLILRILRRIRETTEGETEDWPEALRKACPNGIRPEDVAVLYVQPGENGAEVIEMPVTVDGEFTCDWPGGFFEERLKEFF